MDAPGTVNVTMKRLLEETSQVPAIAAPLPERQGSHQSASEADTTNTTGRCAKNAKRSDGQAASQRHIATEQRRRDRINEGFVELQQLLPGKEKVEKAMMLSQAAEYIQQLQGVLHELMTSGAINTLSEELQWQIRVLLPRKNETKPPPKAPTPAASLPPTLPAALPNTLQPYLGLLSTAGAPEAATQQPMDEGALLVQVQALLQQHQQQAAAVQQLQGWQQALQTLQLQQALQAPVVPDLYAQLCLPNPSSNPLGTMPSLLNPFNANALSGLSAPQPPISTPVPRPLGSAFVDELPKCGLQQLVDAAACEPSNKSLASAASPHKARKNVKVRRHTTAARIPKPDDAGIPPRAGPGRPGHV